MKIELVISWVVFKIAVTDLLFILNCLDGSVIIYIGYSRCRCGRHGATCMVRRRPAARWSTRRAAHAARDTRGWIVSRPASPAASAAAAARRGPGWSGIRPAPAASSPDCTPRPAGTAPGPVAAYKVLERELSFSGKQRSYKISDSYDQFLFVNKKIYIETQLTLLNCSL